MELWAKSSMASSKNSLNQTAAAQSVTLLTLRSWQNTAKRRLKVNICVSASSISPASKGAHQAFSCSTDSGHTTASNQKNSRPPQTWNRIFSEKRKKKWMAWNKGEYSVRYTPLDKSRFSRSML